MTDYQKNMSEFLQYDNYEFLTGSLIKNGPEIAFEDISYHARKASMFPGIAFAKNVDRKIDNTANALYLHIPFCNLRCSYCGFYKNHFDAEAIDTYVKALLAEIDLWRQNNLLQGRKFQAVFFGGGTPAVLNAEQIRILLQKIKTNFALADAAEITFESSIYDLNEAKIAACLENGVNRFSFGVQTFDTALRHKLGRHNNCDEVINMLKSLQGRATVIIDLIYGLIGQDKELLRHDLDLAKECGVNGLDLYKLQIMTKSPLGQAIANKRLLYTHTHGDLLDMYMDADKYLANLGAETLSCCHWKFDATERSLYNSLVKHGQNIVSLGCSCGGRLGDTQYMKLMDREKYIKEIASEKIPVMGFSKQNKYYPLLNLLAGHCDVGNLDFQALGKVSELDWENLFQPILQKWQKLNLLYAKESKFIFTPVGKFYYRQLERVLLTAMEEVLYGKASLVEKTEQKVFGLMKNLK